MTRVRIIIEPEAKSDIRAARDYYRDKGERVAKRFQNELIELLDLLSQHPESVAIAFGRTRLKSMRFFPYVIGFIYCEQAIHVTGVQYGGLGWGEFRNRD
ncbi:MAG: type II toxin-antitoxin system RelE/ParE family toxin [Planctomycetota bacterium]